MDPKINQKTITFISHHWSRGSHRTQTDEQHCHRLEKINKVHIHLTVKTCSPDRQGQAGGGSFSAPREGGAVGIGGQKQDGEG